MKKLGIKRQPPHDDDRQQKSVRMSDLTALAEKEDEQKAPEQLKSDNHRNSTSETEDQQQGSSLMLNSLAFPDQKEDEQKAPEQPKSDDHRSSASENEDQQHRSAFLAVPDQDEDGAFKSPHPQDKFTQSELGESTSSSSSLGLTADGQETAEETVPDPANDDPAWNVNPLYQPRVLDGTHKSEPGESTNPASSSAQGGTSSSSSLGLTGDDQETAEETVPDPANDDLA